MSTEVSKEGCLAEVVLDWPRTACRGIEFSVSETIADVRGGCLACIAPCVNKLIADRKMAEEAKQRALEAEQRALIDAITGLPTRQVFEETFSRMVRRRKPFGFMIIDIDGQKRVNDAMGHSQGDDVLRLLTSTVTKLLRPLDKMFRIGGDEFAVILEKPDEPGEVVMPETFGRRFEDAFDVAVEQAGFSPDLKLGASVGVGVYRGGDSGNFFDMVDSDMFSRKFDRRVERNAVFIDSRELPPSQDQ